MANFCGGFIPGETLKIVDGIVTVAHEDDNPTGYVTICGQAFDDRVFAEASMNGLPVLTSIGVEADMDAPHTVSVCGFAADARYFEVNGRTLDFHERYLLEVVTTPVNAAVVVTVNEEEVQPFEGTRVYPMDEESATYTVTVSAEGYTTQEQEIEATENQLIEITLIEA